MDFTAYALVDVADSRLGVALQVFQDQRGQAMWLNAFEGGLAGELEAAQLAWINKLACCLDLFVHF